MKVAIVHDFLKEYGGAERVVEVFHEIWPDAPIYTSFVDYKGLGPHAERIRKWNIIESRFGKTLLMRKLHSPLRFLAPLVWRGFDFSSFDVVLSSSGWYISRGVTVEEPVCHVCYLHHPPRHLYGYQTAVNWQKYWPVRIYGNIVNHFLRMYDFISAQNVGCFIANSKETQKRIAKFYRRKSTVIYPPVSINRRLSNKEQPLPNNYFLVVSRLARAKHIDLAIYACQELKKPLVLVGTGREKRYLQSLISNPEAIRMLGETSDEELPSIYKHAKALLFPAEDEEFGIVPVEAMGYGIPVIAYRSGGVVETIVDGKTGLFFDKLNVDSLKQKIKYFDESIHRSDEKYKRMKRACRARAREFSKERFKKEMTAFVKRAVKKPL